MHMCVYGSFNTTVQGGCVYVGQKGVCVEAGKADIVHVQLNVFPCECVHICACLCVPSSGSGN